MGQSDSIFQDLSESDIRKIRNHGVQRIIKKNELVFAEGDQVDSFYVVERGRFSIFIDKYGKKEEISIAQAGDYFGEMAIFDQNKRLASVKALEDSELLAIDKDEFLKLVKKHPRMAKKINTILAKRNEELLLKENLIDATGLSGDKLHVGIKGDPSLRESAFSRERYESIVDKVLPELIPNLESLLLERCAYKVFVAFNSGEVRVSSIYDPFYEEIHTANKLIDTSYIERHFPKVSFEEKTKLIKNVYQFVMKDKKFNQLPMHWKNVYHRCHKNWQPIDQQDITKVLTKLVELRGIQSFYLRNFSISMIHNAIRMQFNCDGTHIVSTDDYQRFLDETLEAIN